MKKKHAVVSVYRPCLNNSDGSLRTTLECELKGKLEETLWGVIGEQGDEEIRIVGGDFNMNGPQVDKELLKQGQGIVRVKSNDVTFRRMDSVKGVLQESVIDHILTAGTDRTGAKTSDGGMDANDHAILIGWVELPMSAKRDREMRTPKLPTIRPTDKGATSFFFKIRLT